MTTACQLIYLHDPMCSWCWGFRPTFEQLCASLPRHVAVRRLLGGLAPDSDQPMPADMQMRLQQTWRRIQQRIPGTRFNFDFWRVCDPRRSTWPACRAVIAAREFDRALETAMITAIQRAYYLEARNPSDSNTLVSLAEHLGIDGMAFAQRLDAPETQATLADEIAQARGMGADSFPSLRLQIGDSLWPVPLDYMDAGAMSATIQALSDPPP
ncbi:MAG: DsbA family protein [Sedimenticolaceae bacterium]